MKVNNANWFAAIGALMIGGAPFMAKYGEGSGIHYSILAASLGAILIFVAISRDD